MKTTEELIEQIQNAEKKTLVLALIQEVEPLQLSDVRSYGDGFRIVIGDWKILKPQLLAQQEKILQLDWICPYRNSAWPLMDLREQDARIEPGALIREEAEIGRQAVIMMGAVINMGAQIGEATMIDMNAVIGARAQIGQRCHIGAGAVVAGVLEPASASPTVIEDGVLVGANAVILEGVRIGHDSVVAAGAVVTRDLPPRCVAAGMPARIIKDKDDQTERKTALQEKLRTLE